MERHVLLLLASTMFVAGASAQSFRELDVNNVRARFYSDGMIGMDLAAGVPAFEVPNGAGTHPLFVAKSMR